MDIFGNELTVTCSFIKINNTHTHRKEEEAHKWNQRFSGLLMERENQHMWTELVFSFPQLLIHAPGSLVLLRNWRDLRFLQTSPDLFYMLVTASVLGNINRMLLQSSALWFV